jgi:hypothetical protein
MMSEIGSDAPPALMSGVTVLRATTTFDIA